MEAMTYERILDKYLGYFREKKKDKQLVFVKKGRRNLVGINKSREFLSICVIHLFYTSIRATIGNGKLEIGLAMYAETRG